MIYVTPSTNFPIVRQLQDASDTTTYYVQAVVRDSVSGKLLATIELEDIGEQRFTKNYPAPTDPSGLGRYIDITTIVYSDDAYTTRANFSDENETYLIKQDSVHLGGAGETVSYPEIRKIIKQELEKLVIPQPQVPEDLRPRLKSMEDTLRNEITKAVNGIQIPEQVKPNLDMVVSEIRTSLDEVINTLLIAIDNKEVTPQTDLAPVMQAIQTLPVEELRATLQQTQEMAQTLQAMVESNDELTTLKSAAEQFTQAIGSKKLPQKKEPEQNPYQIRAQRLLGNKQMA